MINFSYSIRWKCPCGICTRQKAYVQYISHQNKAKFLPLFFLFSLFSLLLNFFLSCFPHHLFWFPPNLFYFLVLVKGRTIFVPIFDPQSFFHPCIFLFSCLSQLMCFSYTGDNKRTQIRQILTKDDALCI